jgi:FkbM family methyltransferase
MDREKIIRKILENEELKKISKVKRIFTNPIKTIPYYFIAAATKIHPFVMSFKTLWGDKITSDMPNGNTFLYFGYPEANLTNYFIKNIQEGDVFIDGGANIGFYSMLASNLVGSTGRIFSFEPTPSTFRLLIKNTHNYSNVELNNSALFNEKKELDFIDYGLGYNSFNSIYKRKNIKEIDNRDHKIKIQAVTLDDFCSSQNIKPDFIKLDLEGSERFAIQGAINTIKENTPVISLEVAGDDEWSDNIKIADKLLKDIGYKSFAINTNGDLIEHELEYSYNYDNLIYKHDNN